MPSIRWALAPGLLVVLSGAFGWAQSESSKLQPGNKMQSVPQYPSEIEGKALAQWVPELKNTDPSAREEAIRKVVLFGPLAADVVTVMIDRTRDSDCSPRVRAVMALSRAEIKKEDIPRVVEALARRLTEDSQLVVRYQAAWGLVRFGEFCAPVIPKLVHGTEIGDRWDLASWEIRQPCVIALARAGRVLDGPADLRATTALTNALKDPAYEVRLEAIMGLAYMGRTNDKAEQARAENELVNITRGPNKILSIWATYTLLRIAHPNTTDAVIVKCLKDPDVRVRCESARAIGMMGVKGGTHVRDLVQLLNDPDPVVVLSGIGALVTLGPQAHDAMEPLAQLKNNKDMDERIRLAAGDALAFISKAQPKR